MDQVYFGKKNGELLRVESERRQSANRWEIHAAVGTASFAQDRHRRE